jgi:D-tagatose-1,6-bisphosphate aldolase subunit GatZ/KbaZ
MLDRSSQPEYRHRDSPAAAVDRLAGLKSDHLSGRRKGATAVCSAHRDVLTAAFDLARIEGTDVLIEATANQVNQFGGYTGMTPADFNAYVRELAAAAGFPLERIVLGADHLGPQIWKNEPAERAMARAAALVKACVAAGFRKLHLDTGGGCADDPQADLPPELTARRAAILCAAAETAADFLDSDHPRPLYVIGSEVPPPGGRLAGPSAARADRAVSGMGDARNHAVLFSRGRTRIRLGTGDGHGGPTRCGILRRRGGRISVRKGPVAFRVARPVAGYHDV